MGVPVLRRAAYRVRQFFRALAASLAPLTAAEQAAARAVLPEMAWPLFDAMPRNDQRHSLAVLRALRAAGRHEPALLQAALLHDAAKAAAGLTLLHRVAIVLLKAFRPQVLAAWAALPQPPRSDLRYPFWAHANHPATGADMAAAAGCEPLAVLLIRRHQDLVAAPHDVCGAGNRVHWNRGISRPVSQRKRPVDPAEDRRTTSIPAPQSSNARIDDLLAALQAADDDN